MSHSVEQLPGYRRRIRIEPRNGAVLAMLEDDIHAMAVTLRHAGGVVTAVEPVMERRPWTTCPGAIDQLVETFAGQPLSEVTARRAKRANCTHLHDLACFAAAHAAETEALVYDVLVSDPAGGERRLEVRRNGQRVFHWCEKDDKLVEPASLAGLSLMELRDWIAALPEAEQEPARVLQWAGMVAHGRSMSMEAQQAIAATMPASCYTFQPERIVHALRNGPTRDFSGGAAEPLDHLAEKELARAFGE
jgi:hypothetical protein